MAKFEEIDRMEQLGEPSTPDTKGSDFNFSAEDVLKTLRPASGKTSIEYIGTAVSHWQAEPLLYGPDGKPQVFSDWEFELVKNIEGKPSKIAGRQDPEKFPQFLKKKEAYINRSAELGDNMFRFSLDFARLCPKEGEFDNELMADYVKALALVRARGQEPMLALYHWPMPVFMTEKNQEGNISHGGWENPETAKQFQFYIENIVKFLADEDKMRGVLSQEQFGKEAQDKFLAEGLVKYFISVNEPINCIFTNYVAGVFPPFKIGRLDLAKKTLEKLIESHDIMRDQLKSGILKVPREREPQVGVAHAWNYFDGSLGEIAHDLMNRHPAQKFERSGDYTDFLGLQYYFRSTLPFYKDKKGRDYGEHPDFGDVYPPGMYKMLMKMNEEYPQKDIFISEFGFSDNTDTRRPYWILETMRYIIQAKKEGIPVKGMLLWSIANNFEWALGMDQKFGLFDESELSHPLVHGANGGVKSWEAWQAATRAITDPSEESLKHLQEVYEKAYQQYKEVGGNY
jgi:beta-glucosidase